MTLLGLLLGGWLLTALAPLLAHRLGHRAGWPLAVGLLGLAATALGLGHNTTVEQSVPWIPSLDIALRLRLDGLALLFVALVLVVGALVMVYSTAYFCGKPTVGYYTLMTAFAASMTMLVLADDLVLLFVSWEFTTLCSYLLILRSGPDAGPPATRTLLVTVAGGLCLLAAVATIMVRTGTTHLTTALADPAWREDGTFATTVAILVAVAAMTKAAQFPFHSWLPDAMVAPAPVSAYLHAAAMVKAGIYLLLRFAEPAAHAPAWSLLLITVGLVSSVIGGVFALQRTDLKALLAYSTVSHLGLLTLVIGVGTAAALTAAVVHVVAHAAFKSAAFLYVGLLEKRAGTRDIREISGLWRSMPFASMLILVAAVAMAGIPPTLGFVSKELVLDSLLHGRGAMLAVLVALSSAITVAYSGRMVVSTLPGAATRLAPAPGTWPMVAAIAVGAVAAGTAGVVAPALDPFVGRAVAAAGGSGDVHLALWHGVNPALGLSLAVIAVGALFIVARRGVDRMLDRRLFPLTGVGVVEAVQRAVQLAGRRLGDLTRTDAPAAHLAVPLVLIAGLGVTGLLALTPSWVAADSTVVDVAILVVLTGGVIATVVVRSRLGAVIAVGVAGFSVAVWFFTLGASDVALTQLLVEILTVVIMVLVLRHLPQQFGRRSARRAIPAAILAIAAGVVATLGTLVFTGRAELSAVGRWFVEEGPVETGGANVVNTILVEFRALDTFGELVVLAIAALAITALVDARPRITRPVLPSASSLLAPAAPNAVFINVFARVLIPLMLLGSLYALLRGHNAPGGGFIAALIGAGALATRYLGAPDDKEAHSGLPYLAIAGSGIVVAAVSGFIGYAERSFLTPLYADILGYHVTTSLIFDLGVYLAVLGVILGALDSLGSPEEPAAKAGDRR